MAGAEAALTAVLQVRDEASPKVTVFTDNLVKNKVAIRELSMGAMHLGVSFLAMGAALKSIQNPMAQTISNTLMIVGGVLSFIGTAGQFVVAISKIVHALRELAIMETIVKALTNPLGAALAIGVAGVATAGVIAMTSRASSGGTVINNNIQGSVVTERQIADMNRKQIVLNQQRNNTSGVK